MKRPFILIILLVFVAFISSGSFFARGRAERAAEVQDAPRTRKPIGHPAYMSPQASPIAVFDGRVFVANTTADTVDVIDATTRKVIDRVNVGINPVSVAIRPDGLEVWVANHVSDSVSVIDNNPASPTYLQVIATIQDFHPITKSTRFDEPVGIAFANNEKAYVAISSENKIAVINVASRSIEKTLPINAQDPRAIVVRGDRLYVIPFESNNQTQLSGGTGPLDGHLTTFDAKKHVIDNNNVLSIGAVVDIVKHPRVPDRDLYVFDTKTDKLVEVVDTLGTLLYGLAVDSRGRVFIAQTDARNDVNGRAGTRKHGLAELANRAFLNRITKVEPEDGKSTKSFIDLEPLPPNNPKPGEALATPFAIKVSGDDVTIVATAAGSDTLFTVDAKSGKVLGRAEVGAVPQGLALESSESGKPVQAWVLNAAADSVSLVNLADPSKPEVVETIALEDPTHPAVKRGRIAFTTAKASTTGTYSCASCHPDAHTDQLIWVLATPIVTDGDQIMPRTTMPCRGLRDTAPYHWDGIPGDPYGGINSANVHKSVAPNSDPNVPESSTRNLVDGALAGTMKHVDNTAANEEGKLGALTKAERDAMAKFLLAVPFPPAQRRAYTNVLSGQAAKGFKLFHIDGDNDPSKSRPNVCGDCHRMPFWVSTNTPGTGMEAPTWRGAYDRWLILPQGRLNIIDFDFFREITENGTPERDLWRFSWSGRSRFDPIWDMVLEGSTGFSGAFGRQVTLDKNSLDPKSDQNTLTIDLLNALEQSAREGSVVLQGEGVFINGAKSTRAVFEFDPRHEGGRYLDFKADRAPHIRSELLSLAKEGKFVGTFTARLGAKVDVDNPQPAIWTLGPVQEQRGRQKFPVLHLGNTVMTVSGRHIRDNAEVFVDGKKVEGSVTVEGDTLKIGLASLPDNGTHFLQVQNPDGLMSNDFIFLVAENEKSANALTGNSLQDLLTRHKWDRLLGTWVDPETKGKSYKVTYAWKIPGEVIEMTSHEPDKESTGLIVVDGKSAAVQTRGADNKGTTFTINWAFEDNGVAVLKVGFANREGPEGTFNIRQHLEGNDTLIQTIELPTPITIKRIRETK